LSIKEKELTELTVKLSDDVCGYRRSNNLKNTQRNVNVILNSFNIPFHGRFTILTITYLDSTESLRHGSIPSLFLYNIALRS